MTIVNVTGLSHSFGDQCVLDDISLAVPQGSIYGFLGANGAGKTTTLRLLLSLLQKQSGKITVLGNDLSYNRVSSLGRIGSLIEQPSLYLHLTGKENLEVFRLSYDCSRSRIDEVLCIVGLTGTDKKKVRSYSLGMKQRLAIAVALLHDPELLILDEPTNGLDPNGIVETRELIKKLNRENGKTIIVSSHLLHEIEKMVTDVAIIHKGKIVFQNTLDQLLAVRSTQSIIEIEVNEIEKALDVLKPHFEVTVAKGKLYTPYKSKEQIGEINRLLSNEQVSVYGLVVLQNDLENLFIQITSA